MLWLFFGAEFVALLGIFLWGIHVGRWIERSKQKKEREQ
jgi:hypothetical protein